MTPPRSNAPRSSAVHRRSEPARQAGDGEHAPGAVLWGVLAQLRHPRLLATFLVSGLGAAAATFALIGAGDVPGTARPLAVPGALLVLTTWVVAYRQAGPLIGAARPLRSGRAWEVLGKLPDVLVLYGVVGVLVYATARLSLLVFSGHYTPRLVILLAVGSILVHTVLATPAVVLEDLSIPGALARSWSLTRGHRLTLLGIWLFALLAVATLWLALQRLLETYPTLGVLAVLGGAAGILLGGFHLAVVRIYA